MPDEARGTSRKAAVAFVRHWVDTLNYSADTGDTTSLRSMTSRCVACDGIADFIEEVYSAGGAIETAGWDIADIWIANRSGALLQVATQVDSPGQVVRVPGTKKKQYEGGPSLKVFTLEPTSNGWTVSEMRQS